MRGSPFCFFLVAASLSGPAAAIEPSVVDLEFEEILALDIADLTVTSVSKRAQKLNQAAAAVYVVTSEDLRRSGVTSIPDALRMVPGVNVAQVGSNRWAISARGFNSVLANKLLVMIDGRTVYTPIYSGTYWDDQSTLIENIERIEVIRGPGASLYGANAVNGIISIITKNAAQTQGNYLSAAGGNEERFVEARHGSKAGNAYWRSYGRLAGYDDAERPGGADNRDAWRRARVGFRVDSEGKRRNVYTVHGDAYTSRFDSQTRVLQPTAPFTTTVTNDNSSYGGNVLGRWTHALQDGGETSLQAYLDHYTRQETIFNQRVSTADVQFQHNFALNERNHFIWGTGARYIVENTDGTYAASLNDRSVERSVLNFFAQNEYAVIPREMYLTLGSKFEHNSFTGFEVQPSARLSWQLATNQTLWASVARAVRTPSEIEDQVVIVAQLFPTTPPGGLAIVGNTGAEAEELIAYELGWRYQPTRRVSLDTALFYNDYDNLQAFSQPGTPFVREGTVLTPFPFATLGEASTYGVEIAPGWSVTDTWRLSGSYSFLMQDFELNSNAFAYYTSGTSPKHQASLRSYLNLSKTVQWDAAAYYVSSLNGGIGSYMRLDTRLGWQALPNVELSLIGMNLLNAKHKEFPNTPQAQIERAGLARVTVRF